MNMLNTCIVEGVVEIIDKKKDCNGKEYLAVEINNGNYNLMIHTTETKLKENQQIRVVGRIFTGGVIAEHVEIKNG